MGKIGPIKMLRSADPPRRVLEDRERLEFAAVLFLVVVHIPLGILMYSAGSWAMIHPIAALSVGLFFALQKRYNLGWVAIPAGYIIGAEVLWRMAGVPIYWEFGKYSMAMIMILALLVRRKYGMPTAPLIYGLLLIPACFLTFAHLNASEARGLISADMSGPIALVVACWFFSKTQLDQSQLRRLFYTIMLPLVSVAFVTLFFTPSAEDIQFTTESNFATSGGFGPNQVSSMLGLGVMVACACLILFENSKLLRVALGVLALFWVSQSVMTFSRGGIYNAVGAVLVLVVFHFRNPADGLRRIVLPLLMVFVFFWFIFPSLNDFTGGKLDERFREIDTTNRIDIVWSDLEIFLENPIFGVGVGGGRDHREKLLTYSAAPHTEFSRLISDHGSFGLAAFFVLMVMAFRNVTRSRRLLQRALVMGFSAWCVLYMLNTGMRLAAPSYLWGLTFVSIVANRPIRRSRVLSRSTGANSIGYVPHKAATD